MDDAPLQTPLVELDVEAALRCTRSDVEDQNNIRRYLHRKGMTLPGDIDLIVTEYNPGAFHVAVWEKPRLPDDSAPQS